MKSVPAELLALINTGDYADWDLISITLQNSAVVLRYTNANFNITDGTNIWHADGVRISKDGTTAQAHWKTGLDVDTWQITFVPRPTDPITGDAFPDTIGDVPWLEAVDGGALDYADVEVSRAYFATAPTYPLPAGGAAPLVGSPLVIFAGLVAEADTTHMIATITLRDYRTLLTAQTPPHVFQAACRHTLFDVGCTLLASNFVKTGTVTAGSTKQAIIASGLPIPGGSGTYKLGRIVFTSGRNNTFARSIADWDGNFYLSLVNPLAFDPEVGDTFDIYPGCDKSFATCTAFGNTPNYGGQEFIPSPEAAI